MVKDDKTRFTVQLAPWDRMILGKLVEMGVFMNDSDALRAAIRQLGAQYGIAGIENEALEKVKESTTRS